MTFFNNSNTQLNTGIVQVDNRTSLTIGDSCVFSGNKGTPIQAYSTTVSLSGVVIFENNVAFQGGAISLHQSMLRLVSINRTKTRVIFANNTANSTGGAIYIDSSVKTDSYTGSSCFYEIHGVSLNEVKEFIALHFISNTAADGGNDIYGASPNSRCWIRAKYVAKRSFLIKDIFQINSGLSPISSDPKRVCLYDSSQLMCANLSHIFYNTTRYPGEVFPLSLAVVGLDFGTVTGPVYAYLLNSLSSLGSGERVRQFRAQDGVTQLNFTVSSQNSREVIVLTVNSIVNTEVASKDLISSRIPAPNSLLVPIPLELLTVPVYINVTLLDCPPGFQIINGACKCSKALEDIGIKDCLIYDNTAYFHRSGNQWIGQESNSSILKSKYCPFNYCKQNIIQLNANIPDEQCALNHTGVLCGSCPPNLSLAIGSSRCLECSGNYHTMLLIAFAGAGILLVLFIKILDITVTIGTINGLIFYANIIWANQSVLFPPPAQTSSLLQFLKTFIAWLNLDLGIETCFIQHLDGYWKTWLQFVFPAYIWLIVGLIILASHYSVRITRVLGSNSVSVLATLFLLSYAKLLRAILIVLEFTVLDFPEGQRLVWSFDGNIQYFSSKHSILFVMAVIVLLLLWLPYTFSLLFIQCLRRHSDHHLLRWVNKLTPLFDSYLGPLKHRHHYWIGLGLLARLVLLLTSTVTLITMPIIASLVIILTAFILSLLVLNVYKQWQLSLLEGCFLFNMVMFCSGTLYIRADGGSEDSLACTSLGITFVLFLAIIGYHVWKRILSLKGKRNICNGYEKIDNIQTPPQNPTQSPPPCQPPTYQVVVPSLRDSILDSVVID